MHVWIFVYILYVCVCVHYVNEAFLYDHSAVVVKHILIREYLCIYCLLCVPVNQAGPAL